MLGQFKEVAWRKFGKNLMESGVGLGWKTGEQCCFQAFPLGSRDLID